jgi:hypothetical protein
MEKLHIISSHLPSNTEEKNTESGRSVSKRYLINKLNYINFQDRTILVNFKHKKYDTPVSLQASPLPCSGDRLDCVWTSITDPTFIRTHTFHNLFISDGKKCFLANPHVININDQGISLLLPETCSELSERKMKRHPCTGIHVLLTQNSAMLKGILLDSSSVSFRIQAAPDSSQAFQWINCAAPVNLQLCTDHELLYSGECVITRRHPEQSSGIFVLTASNNRFQRYKPKQFRSSRYTLTPSPNMVFAHPFTGNQLQMKTIDLSGSGFSVEESAGNAMLIAGLILPELELSFTHSFRITCRAQVVYRNSTNGREDGVVKCGLTILDMAMEDQIKLLSLLQQVDNSNSYINTSVDMDALWNFFFETGFIYPDKYSFFQTNKAAIKKLYERLYNHNPGIARHFIHQDKGAILGHMSMVRCYENSWLIHHHAASKTESMKAGIMVLKQISDYLNDLHRLQSAHLDYVFCYFRPDNKFPKRVFGGVARQLNDPKGCSLDDFAYFHYRQAQGDQLSLQEPWVLAKSTPGDLSELKEFYKYVSGGLMINAFDLQAGTTNQDELDREYQRLGFKKEKRLYSLHERGILKALIMVNITNIGLNMTNLTNCATVIIIDDSIPRCFIDSTLSQLSREFEHFEMPVLMYPVSYAENTSIPVEKIYSLWILNLEYTEQYFKFCDTFFNLIRKTS